MIVLFLPMGISVIVRPLLFLHAFYSFLTEDLDHIHQTQGLRGLFAHGFQDLFHPDIILTAHVNEQITVLDIPDILGSRLVGMNLLTGFEQHTDIRLPARNLPGKIEGGKNGGDYLQAADLFLPGSRRPAACQQEKGQDDRSQQYFIWQLFELAFFVCFLIPGITHVFLSCSLRIFHRRPSSWDQ